jgi:peptide/nickel transport system permease protein
MRFVYFLVPRIAVALLTMFGVSLLVFFCLRLLPGGFADLVLGPFADPATKAEIARRFGLDQPVFVQFFKWLGAVLSGDFGVSMADQSDVLTQYARRLPATAEIAIVSLTIGVALGVPLGVLAAVATGSGKQGTAVRLLGAFGISVPESVIATALIFIFSYWSLGLRVGGYVPFTQDPWGNILVMTLPTVSLGILIMSVFIRVTRDSVMRVMTEGYILAAVARGETPWQIVRHHILRNASIPVVTLIAIYFAGLMGGVVVVERLFTIPGVGYYFLVSLEARDFAIVQAGVLLSAFFIIAMNMLCDVAYAIIDPRIGAKRSST